jgi:peptidyl-prolyl cis-trans isomerase B (cyclophilin B)
MKKYSMYAVLFILLSITALLSGCGNKPEKDAANNTANNSANNTNDIQEPAPTPASEPTIPDGQHPVVTIEMEDGAVIKAELYPHIAPNTVNNFISLANQGFYDGVIFHRVIPGFMIQGGDPEGTGMGGPGYAIKGEFTDNDFENNLKHDRGVLSMARQGDPYRDTAGSQFFIMHADSPHLDNAYASFGKVIEGIEVVDQIAAAERAAQDRPVEEQKMKKVTVETFGVEYPEPEIIE